MLHSLDLAEKGPRPKPDRLLFTGDAKQLVSGPQFGVVAHEVHSQVHAPELGGRDVEGHAEVLETQAEEDDGLAEHVDEGEHVHGDIGSVVHCVVLVRPLGIE